MRILETVTNHSAPTAAAPRANRLERNLAYAIVVIVALSIVCFVAVIVGTYAGVGENDGFSQGIWPIVFFVPYLGLPIAFALILAIVWASAVRRSQAAKAAAASSTSSASPAKDTGRSR